MSILTGNNPFADYKAGRKVTFTEASVKIDIDDKEDQKTKQKENDSKPASPEEIEKGTEKAAGDVKDAASSDDPNAMAGAGEEGMPDPENPGDLNGDGVVDMKDKKIAELEKDMRIRELERGIADIDDPEVEPGLKKAAPERPRIKNRGDHYAIINDAGEELEKIPYDNKKTSAREARYQALRRVDAIAMELNADHTAGIKQDPEGKLGEIDKQAAKDMEKANDKMVKAGAGDDGAGDAAAAGKADPKAAEGMGSKGSEGKSEGESKSKKAVKEEVNLQENAKIMKMLKGLDKDEARIIIQGLPKNLRAKAMKHIGLKEDDMMPEVPSKVDGRSKAYRETAKRIMNRKNKMMAEQATEYVVAESIEEYEFLEEHLEQILENSRAAMMKKYGKPGQGRTTAANYDQDNRSSAQKRNDMIKKHGRKNFRMTAAESITLDEIDEEFDTLTEKRMFIAAARAAFAKGDKEFLFNGKTYPVKITEGAKKGQKVKINGDEYEVTDIEEMDDEPTDGSSGEEIRRKEMRVNEARRGKMSKDDEAEAEHPIMQLRKAISLRSVNYQFASTGKTMKISDREARKLLQMYDKADRKMKMAMQSSMTGNEKAMKDLLAGKMPQAKRSPLELPKLRSQMFEAGYDNGQQDPSDHTGETPRSGAHMGKMPQKAEKLKEYSGTDFYADYIKRTTKK